MCGAGNGGVALGSPLWLRDVATPPTSREAKAIEPTMLLSADLGLDSLDLAQTIVLLERSLGIDPFRTASGTRPAIRSVADLVAVYTQALTQS